MHEVEPTARVYNTQAAYYSIIIAMILKNNT